MCSATGDPLPDISWEKDGQIILPDLSDKIDVQESQQTSPERIIISTLTISNIAAGDMGNYTCYASSGVGSTSIVASPFSIIVRPGSIFSSNTYGYIIIISLYI